MSLRCQQLDPLAWARRPWTAPWLGQAWEGPDDNGAPSDPVEGTAAEWLEVGAVMTLKKTTSGGVQAQLCWAAVAAGAGPRAEGGGTTLLLA